MGIVWVDFGSTTGRSIDGFSYNDMSSSRRVGGHSAGWTNSSLLGDFSRPLQGEWTATKPSDVKEDSEDREERSSLDSDDGLELGIEKSLKWELWGGARRIGGN